ncbi:MAG: ATP-binding cassette domain-containing protein, partial [Burkholderiales bacterium]
MDTGITLTKVEKWFGTRAAPVFALSETTLDIRQGELLVLLGPSGCGKTTLLRMIGGLIKPTRGAIKVAGHDLWRDDTRQ